MNVIAMILLIIAAVLFFLTAFWRPSAPAWFAPLGWTLLTVGLIVQYCATTHSITF